MKAYDKWETVMMPIHAADHAYLSSSDCLKYVLSQPGVHVAICGAGTQGQMEDNIRAVQNFRRMTSEQIAVIRKRAITGSGVHTGTTLEYWKKS